MFFFFYSDDMTIEINESIKRRNFLVSNKKKIGVKVAAFWLKMSQTINLKSDSITF